MTTVYIHIPRTAGTSFRIVAEKAYGKDKILAIYGDEISRAVELVEKLTPPRSMTDIEWSGVM